MNTSRFSVSRSLSTRLPALLRAGALALTLALLPHGAARAQQGPLATSPTTPTPFSWGTFHSGGTNPTAVPTATVPLLPPNPLASQLQGTPTGLNGADITQIPSFLIGNYDYTLPPAGVDGATPPNIAYFPNHFGNDILPNTISTWSAPFTFLAAAGQSTTTVSTLGHTTIAADDSQTAAYLYQTYSAGPPVIPASGVDAGWTVQWTTSVAGTNADTWGAQIADGTAAGDPSATGTATLEYRRQTVVAAAIGSPYPAARVTATWSFTAPTTFSAPAAAGLYSVAFHLPDPQTATNPADGTPNTTTYPEYRISDAHYVIKVNNVTVFDTDTLDSNGNLLSRAGINQTETNDPQPLAGPFALKAGDVLTVTLDNTTLQALAHPTQTYVLADSMSLVPTASAGGSARVDGSPVAVSVGDFPEIANALYYGFQITRDPTTGAPTGRAPDPTTPFGNAVIGTTQTFANSPTAAQHNIRQLVYFGRYEGIVLTNPMGAVVYINGTTTPVTRMVGAIYCVDGITGDVVWRFQTPDVLNPDGITIAKPSAPVYTTPAVARLNVLVDVNGTPTPQTKLCVVAADDNGLVYCLDAIGNRNGTAYGNNADGTVAAGSAVEPVYSQPIYNPFAPLNMGSAQQKTTAGNGFVGNTTAYWVYRPDAARPISQTTATTPPTVKAVDPTSDLPVPAAFGLASPTVYVNPNTATQTGTLLPNGTPTAADPTSASLTSNGIVYIGNSNGTLYSLDAGGTTVTETVPPTGNNVGSGVFYSASDKYNYVLPISQTGFQITTPPATQPDMPLPTPTVKWWFAVNKAATTDTAQTANVAITSAPSIYQQSFTGAGTPTHYIYFGTGNETTNVGNVFAVSDAGLATGTNAPGTLTPGSTDYNILARPFWSFPNAYTNTGDKKIHAALGSIAGSPTVFVNPDDAVGLGGVAPARVYFAANQGPEGYQAERPVPATNGRIWSVDAASGLAQWAYPDTVDPNKDNSAAGNVLLGSGTTLTQTQIDALPTLGTFRNASPAIGIVQFPATINYGATGTTAYNHTDAINTGGLQSARVPMLYVGARTEAPDSTNFFALDLDGTTDNQRNIFFDNTTNASTTALLGVTSGPGFEASPLLVTNPGPTTGGTYSGGNGGVVFAVRADGTLNELSATPLTDVGTGSVSPLQMNNFFTQPGYGVFGSPAIAGYNVTDLAVANTTTTGLSFDSDWIYGSDGTLGVARGITPNSLNNGSSGTTADYGTAGTGPDALLPPAVPQQLPLHVYLFDNTGTHKGTSTNMADANQVGMPIAAFEWGQTLYIRVSNVVPPNPTADATKFMGDPNDTTIYYTNGGPIRVQLSDIDATGKVVAGRGADIATINTNLLANLADPGSNGFVAETGPGLYDDGSHGDVLKDNSGTGSIWLGATSYAIGDGSNRKNTPGSRRQIISATQTVEAHEVGTNKFLQNVILEVTVNSSANSYRVRNPGGNPPFIIKRLPPVDQPTFAVLNPLAVRGGGPNIPLGGGSQVAQIDQTVGPFAGIANTASPNAANGDLAAYVNGNRAYVSAGDVPKSGVLSGDTGQKVFLPVTTVTTDIPHGSVGSNGNPNPTASGFSPTPLSAMSFGNYAFDVADRSVLGLSGGQISAATVQTAPAEWNDNTGSFAGPGAVVNPLPWDDTPTAYRAGTNGSVDYPNISKQKIAQTIHNANSTNGASVSDNPATLDAATGTTSATRTVQADNVDVQVSVPKYQPANLQLYEHATTGFQRIPPAGLTSSMQTVYPMGYVARETVYVDSNHNHRRDDGEAFRTFRVYTGVPVDMTLSVDNPTLDLGKLPQTFGVQTDASSVLGPFMPFLSSTALQVTGAGYQKYFQPITAHNNGNINLLNVQFDQRLLRYNAAANSTGATTADALPFGSDAMSANDTLQAFDLNGVTGPNPLTGDKQFILRTSLDTDLSASNRNPALITQNGAAYPNATFHKARVSDTLPPTLTVPDLPHDNPYGSPYYLPPATTLTTTVNGKTVPVTTGIPTVDPTTKMATSYSPPFIGLAVPLGTPVGAYSQDVRLFEGIDPVSNAYPDVQATGSNLYKPLFPPVYGGVVADGNNMPAATDDQLTTVGSAVTQPYSNPTRVRATITETRVTDGATYGNLPQSQFGPYVPPGTTATVPAAADFLPVAFRSSFWSGGTVTGGNSLSLYWTSARGSSATVPYGLLGIRAPFTVNNNLGYFQADTANKQWFDTISALPASTATSVNTAISLASDQHLLSGTGFQSDGTVFAFVQNVSTPGYQNNLDCYTVEPTTGAIGGAAVPVSADTRQPKFGARGLKYDNAVAKFTDALDPNTTLTDNLWAFWNGGTRGRSTLFYSSAVAANVSAYTRGASPFTMTSQALPTPAGLSAVADPSAIVAFLAQPGGTTVPVIDITYTGVNADGNTDVYVSHYRPYIVRKPGATNNTPNYLTDANGKNVIGLALTPSPAITEQLLPNTAGQFYQARDVAWARADTIDLQVAMPGAALQHILQNADPKNTPNADGSYPLFAGTRTSYDPASGTMAFTNIHVDKTTGQNFFAFGSGYLSITTVYADLVRGRVRLRTAYYASNSAPASRFDIALPTGSLVSATFQAQARRITTDRRADTEPIAFIDDAFKPNEAPGLNRVQTSRYWFVWRKSAAPGTTTTPTLYTKTQRLTLYLHDANNQQVALPLTNGVPTLTLQDKTTSSAININSVDVDWARGRVYFPQSLGVEGHTISATFSYESAQQVTPSPAYTMPDATVQWLDEVRANDLTNQPASTTSADAVDTTEHAVPMDVTVNEGSPSAFLDPLAYADVGGGAYNPFNATGGLTNPTTTLPNPDQPHKVWLFWNSTRSGTADVFYETIDPRFSANP